MIFIYHHLYDGLKELIIDMDTPEAEPYKNSL